MDTWIVYSERRTRVDQYVRRASDGWPDGRMWASRTPVGIGRYRGFVSEASLFWHAFAPKERPSRYCILRQNRKAQQAEHLPLPLCVSSPSLGAYASRQWIVSIGPVRRPTLRPMPRADVRNPDPQRGASIPKRLGIATSSSGTRFCFSGRT